jgi:hypothetical protein
MGYTTGAKCNHCNTEVQSVRHLFLECPRVQLLLKNFKKQYNLLTKLCECARRGTSIVQLDNMQNTRPISRLEKEDLLVILAEFRKSLFKTPFSPIWKQDSNRIRHLCRSLLVCCLWVHIHINAQLWHRSRAVELALVQSKHDFFAASSP